MPDAPLPATWGVHPVLFHLGHVPVPSYGVFVLLGVLAGALVYALEARKHPQLGSAGWVVFAAALIGGTFGAKIPIWVQQWPAILAHPLDPMVWLPGRTVVGGLIGGTLAVIIVRRKYGITAGMGNLFAPAVALAVAIGRIGCLLRGCCFGVESHLPWAIDLGDGVPRHPVQAYEAVFLFALFGYLRARQPHETKPGRLFGLFMLAYFAFRFVIEFLRQEPRDWWGLTLAQLVSLAVVVYYGISEWQSSHQERAEGSTP